MNNQLKIQVTSLEEKNPKTKPQKAVRKASTRVLCSGGTASWMGPRGVCCWSEAREPCTTPPRGQVPSASPHVPHGVPAGPAACHALLGVAARSLNGRSPKQGKCHSCGKPHTEFSRWQCRRELPGTSPVCPEPKPSQESGAGSKKVERAARASCTSPPHHAMATEVFPPTAQPAQ